MANHHQQISEGARFLQILLAEDLMKWILLRHPRRAFRFCQGRHTGAHTTLIFYPAEVSCPLAPALSFLVFLCLDAGMQLRLDHSELCHIKPCSSGYVATVIVPVGSDSEQAAGIVDAIVTRRGFSPVASCVIWHTCWRLSPSDRIGCRRER